MQSIDFNNLSQLDRDGVLADLGDGRKAVRVYLFSPAAEQETTWEERRQNVLSGFQRLASKIPAEKLTINFDTLSVSGRTVEALLATDDGQQTTNQLTQNRIQVEPLYTYQVY